MVDLNLMLSAYGNAATCSDPDPIASEYFYRADVNNNCVIDLADLVALLGNFGLTSASSLHATYLWDAENRLVEVIPSSPTASSKRVRFVYDYLSRRVDKQVFDWNATTEAWETVPSDHRRWVYCVR